jgi:RNA polymerase sigma-70 factor (ECF subfamily)
MTERSPQGITEILARVGRGEEAAAATLLPMVYDELRALAGSFFEHQSPGHTLQPTALVHEAFLKLAQPEAGTWESRAHFFAVAAKAMRQILADHARRKKAAKRGGDQQHRVTLSGLQTPANVEQEIDLIALDEALSKLSELSPRQSQIVEMRFLAGLDEGAVAHVLSVTPRTVQREWRLAKAFLRCELSGNSVS